MSAAPPIMSNATAIGSIGSADPEAKPTQIPTPVIATPQMRMQMTTA